MTSRGLKEKDFVKIGELLVRAADIALAVQEKHGKAMKDFEQVIITTRRSSAHNTTQPAMITVHCLLINRLLVTYF